jgi:hypothetical protein
MPAPKTTFTQLAHLMTESDWDVAKEERNSKTYADTPISPT